MATALKSKQVDDILVIEIPLARIDASNSRELKRDLEPHFAIAKKIVFDLTAVEFIDSSGLGLCLSCLRELNGAGGDLKLASMTKTVRVLFEMVRMHRVFEIHSTPEGAILAFKR